MATINSTAPTASRRCRPASKKGAVPLKPRSLRDERIDQILAFLQQTRMEGLAVILDRAKDVARDYPQLEASIISMMEWRVAAGVECAGRPADEAGQGRGGEGRADQEGAQHE